jgi:hypothetical protein
MYVKAQGVSQDLAVAQMWFNRAAGNPASDQATRDNAIYNSDLIAKQLAIGGGDSARRQSPTVEVPNNICKSWECESARQQADIHQQTVKLKCRELKLAVSRLRIGCQVGEYTDADDCARMERSRVECAAIGVNW